MKITINEKIMLFILKYYYPNSSWTDYYRLHRQYNLWGVSLVYAPRYHFFTVSDNLIVSLSDKTITDSITVYYFYLIV